MSPPSPTHTPQHLTATPTPFMSSAQVRPESAAGALHRRSPAPPLWRRPYTPTESAKAASLRLRSRRCLGGRPWRANSAEVRARSGADADRSCRSDSRLLPQVGSSSAMAARPAPTVSVVGSCASTCLCKLEPCRVESATADGVSIAAPRRSSSGCPTPPLFPPPWFLCSFLGPLVAALQPHIAYFNDRIMLFYSFVGSGHVIYARTRGAPYPSSSMTPCASLCVCSVLGGAHLRSTRQCERTASGSVL